MDQGNAYRQLSDSAPGGVGGFNNSGNSNMAVLDNLFVPPYRCPSSTVPEWASVDVFVATSNEHFLGASYVGVAGAAFRNGNINPSSELVNSPGVALGGSSISLSNGTIHAANGLLLQNETVSFKDISDGTSTTMIVAEQSSATIQIADPTAPDGVRTIDDPNLLLSSYPGSAWPGTGLKRKVIPGNPNSSNAHTLSNVTTVRYAINLQNAAAATTLPGLGIGAGNKPIMSAHPGVAHALFADGSVRALKETMDFNLLMSFADRHDGNVVNSE